MHLNSGHAGIGAMLAIMADHYYICGLKSLLRMISRCCVTCQRAYAKTAEQLMGQLPPERLQPSTPFSHVGIDYAGPLWIKRGNPRKPTIVKIYVCTLMKSLLPRSVSRPARMPGGTDTRRLEDRRCSRRTS